MGPTTPGQAPPSSFGKEVPEHESSTAESAQGSQGPRQISESTVLQTLDPKQPRKVRLNSDKGLLVSSTLPESSRLSPFASVSSIILQASSDEDDSLNETTSSLQSPGPSPALSPEPSPARQIPTEATPLQPAPLPLQSKDSEAKLDAAAQGLREVLRSREIEIEAIHRRASEEKERGDPAADSDEQKELKENADFRDSQGLKLTDTQHSVIETFLDTADHIPSFSNQGIAEATANEGLSAFLR